ncbi:MAG TPA: hypothetical protein PLK80_00265 [bacterium]|nr:MAG: hypothetical protein BWY28_00633 [bacterium ADurb.Bin236]HPI75139.1 hypothetical protein [bacterium]HPN94489.1 hypothetical protein [bacterium]
MDEQEKQMAVMLGDWMDGAGTVGPGAASELAEAAETALLIDAALGGGPELNPAFSDTLRARIIRGSSRPRSLPSRRASRSIWVRYAVAAVLFFSIAPTGIWTFMDRQEKLKMELVEKYDSMYMPYKNRVAEGSGETDTLQALSRRRVEATEDIARQWNSRRAERFFINNSWERSSGK